MIRYHGNNGSWETLAKIGGSLKESYWAESEYLGYGTFIWLVQRL